MKINELYEQFRPWIDQRMLPYVTTTHTRNGSVSWDLKCDEYQLRIDFLANGSAHISYNIPIAQAHFRHKDEMKGECVLTKEALENFSPWHSPGHKILVSALCEYDELLWAIMDKKL